MKVIMVAVAYPDLFCAYKSSKKCLQADFCMHTIKNYFTGKCCLVLLWVAT